MLDRRRPAVGQAPVGYGGSGRRSCSYARSACRRRDRPDLSDGDLGFRQLLSRNGFFVL